MQKAIEQVGRHAADITRDVQPIFEKNQAVRDAERTIAPALKSIFLIPKYDSNVEKDMKPKELEFDERQGDDNLAAESEEEKNNDED